MNLKAEYREFVKNLKAICRKGQHPDMAKLKFNYYMAHFSYEQWLTIRNSQQGI